VHLSQRVSDLLDCPMGDGRSLGVRERGVATHVHVYHSH